MEEEFLRRSMKGSGNQRSEEVRKQTDGSELPDSTNSYLLYICMSSYDQLRCAETFDSKASDVKPPSGCMVIIMIIV